jgi:hypothetical protein
MLSPAPVLYPNHQGYPPLAAQLRTSKKISGCKNMSRCSGSDRPAQPRAQNHFQARKAFLNAGLKSVKRKRIYFFNVTKSKEWLWQK